MNSVTCPPHPLPPTIPHRSSLFLTAALPNAANAVFLTAAAAAAASMAASLALAAPSVWGGLLGSDSDH
eukprot:1145486-Pelagomonas_calceolata.AAC.1